MIFNLIVPVILSRALFVAAELHIADHLAQKPHTIEEIAHATHTHAGALGRLLYFLSLHGIFKQHENFWENTDVSEHMRADHGASVRPLLLHDDATRWHAFGHLKDAVISGKEVFSPLYGTDYFSYIHQNGDLGKRFDDAMRIISDKEENIIAQQMPFSGIVADIGGGKGGLARHILATSSPVDQILLFDLPAVIANSTERSDRVVGIGGDFFNPIGCIANIFILKRILHDWDDAHATRILTNVAQAMRPGDQVYIIDGLTDQAQDKKLLSAIDLAMLTIFGGQERSLDAFKKLIKAAGLELVSIHEMTETLFVLVCTKS